MNNQYQRLLQNLDEFIRKYYWDKIIRGALFLIASVLSFFSAFVLIEYFFYLPSVFRLIVFIVFGFISISSFSFFILFPALKLIGISHRLSYEEAAIKIGKFYPEIDDKILNTIQLHDISKNNSLINVELLNASIEQRIHNFGIFSFKKAINFRFNKKYLKYALPPLIVVLAIIISSPTLIFNSAQRYIHFDSTFVKKAPFEFLLLNDNLLADEGKNFNVELRLQGETIPTDVSIIITDYPYLMQKKSTLDYNYLLTNLKQPVKFKFQAGKYYSDEFTVNLKYYPKIVDIQTKITYPKYISKPQESFSNLSEISIPEGSDIEYSVKLKDADSLFIIDDIGEKLLSAVATRQTRYSQILIRKSSTLRFISSNSLYFTKDTVDYHIYVVKDEFPRIKLNKFTDSIFEKRKFFRGFIRDDYGFTRLKMDISYQTISSTDTSYSVEIPFNASNTTQDFYSFYDFATISAKPGTDISYSFVVTDNDAVSGYKSTRSQIFAYKLKTIDEEQKDADKRYDNLQADLEKSSNEAEKISKQLEDLTQKLRAKKELNWDEKKELEDILTQFENLQKNIENHIEKSYENLEKNKENLKQADELNQKQEEIKKLMEELLTPELKQMLEELKNLMKKNVDKEKIDEKLEQMKFDANFMKEQLDRELEMMKQLKFEQKLQQSIDKLKEIEKEQRELSNDLNPKNSEQNTENQNKLNKEFKDFEELLKDAKNANEELQDKNDLKDTKAEQDSIKQDMNESSKSLTKNKNKSAQSSQKNAADKMKKLGEKLESMQEEMQSESQAEDIENLKNILENLLEISFNQEALMENVKYTSNRDPQFPGFIEDQKKIVNDLAMVEDSLNKIANRNPSISPMVSKELKQIKTHSELAFSDLRQMNTIGPTSSSQLSKSTANQQYIMTSVNNLALMLSEVLNQMQQQQMQSKSNKGSCKNPKPGNGGKGNIKSMRQMQEALQKQIEKMKQELESKGKNPGKGKSGSGGEQISEELSRLAAQQEALRKIVQEYRNQLSKEGKMKEASSLSEAVKQMEKSETELVNKILTSESLKRQKEIVTRLLESENAEREREQSEERESKEGKNENNSNKNLKFKYKDIYQEDIELLRTIPIELRPFYKTLIEGYFSY